MSALVAVLRSTMVSAWRGGAMPIMAALLAAVLLWLPRVSGGDEAAVWQIGLGAGQALLLLGIGWLAVDSVSRDLREGQASLLATRPLDRRVWWLGRWLGVVVVGWLLLAGMLLVAVATARSPQPHIEVQAPLAGPLTLRPDQPASLTMAAGPGELRLTCHAAQVPERPIAVDLAADGQPAGRLALLPDRVYHVAWPGGRSLTLTNRGAEPLVIVSGDELVLRSPCPGRWGSLLRVAALLALQLAFVAALGATAASLVSGQVALFVVVAWLVAAAHAPLLTDSPIVPLLEAGHQHAEGSPTWYALLNAGRVLGLALSDPLRSGWRLGDLAAGRLVPWSALLAALWRVGLLQCGALVWLGLVCWRRREFGLGDRL